MTAAIVSRIGRTRSTVSSSPPIITPSLPPSATFGFPVTGASSIAMPRSFARDAMRRDVSGAIELVSTMIVPGSAWLRTPSFPQITASDAAASVTIVKTTSDWAASCPMLSAQVAPAASSELGPRSGAVPSGQREAALHDVAGHGGSHQAQTDEANVHGDLPSRYGCALATAAQGSRSLPPGHDPVEHQEGEKRGAEHDLPPGLADVDGREQADQHRQHDGGRRRPRGRAPARPRAPRRRSPRRRCWSAHRRCPGPRKAWPT